MWPLSMHPYRCYSNIDCHSISVHVVITYLKVERKKNVFQHYFTSNWRAAVLMYKQTKSSISYIIRSEIVRNPAVEKYCRMCSFFDTKSVLVQMHARETWMGIAHELSLFYWCQLNLSHRDRGETVSHMSSSAWGSADYFLCVYVVGRRMVEL